MADSRGSRTYLQRLQLQHSLSTLFDTLLRRSYEAIQAPLEAAPAEIGLLQEALATIATNPVFQEAAARDLDDRFRELSEAIKVVAAHQYETKRHETLFRPDAQEDGHVFLLEVLRLADWLRSHILTVDRLFRQPILE